MGGPPPSHDQMLIQSIPSPRSARKRGCAAARDLPAHAKRALAATLLPGQCSCPRSDHTMLETGPISKQMSAKRWVAILCETCGLSPLCGHSCRRSRRRRNSKARVRVGVGAGVEDGEGGPGEGSNLSSHATHDSYDCLGPEFDCCHPCFQIIGSSRSGQRAGCFYKQCFAIQFELNL